MRRWVLVSLASVMGFAQAPHARGAEDMTPAQGFARRAPTTLVTAMPPQIGSASTWAAFDSALDSIRDRPEVIDTRDRWAHDISLGIHSSQAYSIDLLVSIPRQQTVNVNLPDSTTLSLGTFKRLPPTVFARWHFRPSSRIHPYVGAGLNLTSMMNRRLTIDDGAGGATPLRLESAIVGPALQAGAELSIAGGWSVSADVRKVWIDSSVTAEGRGKIGAVESDPVNYAVRLGYRF